MQAGALQACSFIFETLAKLESNLYFLMFLEHEVKSLLSLIA